MQREGERDRVCVSESVNERKREKEDKRVREREREKLSVYVGASVVTAEILNHSGMEGLRKRI